MGPTGLTWSKVLADTVKWSAPFLFLLIASAAIWAAYLFAQEAVKDAGVASPKVVSSKIPQPVKSSKTQTELNTVAQTIDARGRVFVPPNITTNGLIDLMRGHTSIQGKKLVEPYLEKWIVTKGNIHNVSERTFGPGLTLTLCNNQPGAPWNIEGVFYFDAGTPSFETLGMLRKNDLVTVLGKITNIDSTSMTIDNCELT